MEGNILACTMDRDVLDVLARFPRSSVGIMAQDGVSVRGFPMLDRSIRVAVVDLDLNPAGHLDLIRSLRRLHPDLPVIVLTSHNSPEAELRVRELGIFFYVVKPVCPRELERVIKLALRRPLSGQDLNRWGAALGPALGPDGEGQ